MIFFVAGCAIMPSYYLDLDSRRSSGLDAVISRIEGERVIFIGEIHGDSSIHLLQFEIIKQLKQRGKKVVVALEPFPVARQPILNKWIDGTLSRFDFELAYEETWTVPYSYYGDIFSYAQDQHIPLLAINAEDALIRQVTQQGVKTVPEDFLRKIRFTDCSSDVQYEDFIRRTYHSSEFPFLCSGQRLRDSVMAFTIANAIRGNDATVVVIAGIAHALKVAVPRLLQNHGAVSCTVLLPQEVEYIVGQAADKGIADYVWYY